MVPEIAEHGHVVAGDVVGYGNARQFDDAAFDGVHEREIGHGPGKERAFGIAGATQEERRSGKVYHPREADFALDGLQAIDPEPGGFLIALRLFLVVARECLFVGIAGLFLVAVVGFVVEDEDVLEPHQVRHDPLEHLSFRFKRVDRGAGAAFK